MTTSSRYGIGTGVISGSIGGFVAGLATIPFFIMTAAIAGLPLDAVLTAMGLAFGAAAAGAAALGIVMHLVTSVLIGMIFGAITAQVQRLRITSHSRGIGEGLIAGMIVFAVLYVPTSMLGMPSAMTQVVTSATGMAQQQAMPMMIAIAIAEYLAFGAVLGAVTAALVVNAMKRKASTAGFVCGTCEQEFPSAREMDEHVKTAHHGVAA